MVTPTFSGTAAALVLSVLTFSAASTALAAGEHGGGHGHAQIGRPGSAEAVTRTVEVTMHDNYYEPESLAVAAGETVRFLVRNEGEFVHEFSLGTAAMHHAHQDEMLMMVEHGALLPDRIDHDRMRMDMGGGRTMEHDDPNALLLEPGGSAELIWTFSRAGELEFACNVPGHYEAGMVGELEIQP